MQKKTTTLSDDEARTEARERRSQRVQALHRLFRLFEGHDAKDEIRRLKEQDEGF
ncbi:MAG: hypothetical protein OXJ53_01020 [Gammaproteobacteria bacterium]|nr:hypothetical protein [Gammaproteobacteria bacterium]